MPDLPTGTVTFLFTDIEGSTTRWEHYPDAMRVALARHDALLRQVITIHGGFVFKMVGDAVYAAFVVPSDAVSAAAAAQQAVAAEEWGEVGPLRVRIALHTGAAQHRDDDYFGPTLNRVARVLSTGYGGQILLSVATVELVRDALPAGATLKDLGEHALKDLLRPEHVFQLTIPDLLADFPPLKSLSRHPHNLPVQPTPFLGRQQEVASVCMLISRQEVRLVTLTGPGGIGKTRLSLQVAADLADQFAEGVWFVPLAPLSDAELVVPTIMQILSISEAGTQPPLTLLKTALKDKHLLLLLDNFEQVITAAVQVAELLAACPKLKVIVTSRVVLHVQAEHEFAVPPLSLPNPKHLPDLVTLSQYEAVYLFISRAQAVKPDFQVTNTNAPAVAAICVRLDGLPLAIELAAARSKLLPPQSLLTRLTQRLAVLTSGARDVPARHQTLRNTIMWSYDLLDAQEQRLFRRLATFVGGCTLEAVEAVCAALDKAEPGDSVLDSIGSLIDKSLLRPIEQEVEQGQELRVLMLETIREYGLEALAASGEMELTRQAHADYYLTWAEEAQPKLFGAQQQVWFDQMEQEHDNLRAAFHWFLERKEAEMALRLAAALGWFWLMRDHGIEGRTMLEQALSGSEEFVTYPRAEVLQWLGLLLFNQVDYEQAERRCEECVALYRELGDTVGMSWPLHHLALVKFYQGECMRARALMEECLARLSEGGDKGGTAYPFCHLALIYSEQGEYDKACSCGEESLALFRELENSIGMSEALFCLVKVLIDSQSERATVEPLLEEYLALAKERPVELGLPNALHLAGRFALRQGDVATARSFIEESLALDKENENQVDRADMLAFFGQVAAAQGDYAAAKALYEESLALAKEKGIKRVIPADLEGLASVAAAQGEPVRAVHLWGVAEALRETRGAPMPPVYRADYKHAVAAVQAQLGEEAFAIAWAEGRATPLEQSVTNALKMGG